MKKKVSLAFVLIACATLLSLSTTLEVLPSLFRGTGALQPISLLRSILITIDKFVPLVITVLLYLNRQKDIRSTFSAVVLLFGISRIASAALGVISNFTIFSILSIVGLLNSVVTGLMLIFASQSIKEEKENRVLVPFAIFSAILTVFPIISYLLNGYNVLTPNYINAIASILLSVTICILPKTIYNYDACLFFDKKLLTLLICIAVVILLIVLISNALSTNSKTNDLEGTKYYMTCPQCKGSGLTNTGFINFKTCPNCNGNGVIFP